MTDMQTNKSELVDAYTRLENIAKARALNDLGLEEDRLPDLEFEEGGPELFQAYNTALEWHRNLLIKDLQQDESKTNNIKEWFYRTITDIRILIAIVLACTFVPYNAVFTRGTARLTRDMGYYFILSKPDNDDWPGREVDYKKIGIEVMAILLIGAILNKNKNLFQKNDQENTITKNSKTENTPINNTEIKPNDFFNSPSEPLSMSNDRSTRKIEPSEGYDNYKGWVVADMAMKDGVVSSNAAYSMRVFKDFGLIPVAYCSSAGSHLGTYYIFFVNPHNSCLIVGKKTLASHACVFTSQGEPFEFSGDIVYSTDLRPHQILYRKAIAVAKEEFDKYQKML